ncbi:hypothetical protein E3U23_08070 [Erythrobacter litoralis]|uniref:hypothetical protein n=1 Tax=Erythrobacter litoralis TaxID=39960 RepID=UPI002434D299|nr:hypothetical protein [Erythrobacter litoralis]MDG6079147.1 hypothetical protein [Erythrobacter litoralis]
MESELLAKHYKKLLAIAALLVGVAMLVGGEENPGVLTDISNKGLSGSANATMAAPPLPEPQPLPSEMPVRDPALDSWYSQSASSPPPQPIPESVDSPTPSDVRPLPIDLEPVG